MASTIKFRLYEEDAWGTLAMQNLQQPGRHKPRRDNQPAPRRDELMVIVEVLRFMRRIATGPWRKYRLEHLSNSAWWFVNPNGMGKSPRGNAMR